jgi:hypothetical protein
MNVNDEMKAVCPDTAYSLAFMMLLLYWVFPALKSPH